MANSEQASLISRLHIQLRIERHPETADRRSPHDRGQVRSRFLNRSADQLVTEGS
jgi:hypothetical protein